MANDNSRKFKQNQMLFCIHQGIVEFSIPIGVGEDRDVYKRQVCVCARARPCITVVRV